MVYKSIIGAMCACLVVVSFSVNSALISSDWKTAGDNLITRDDFGKEWLDLTVTTDQSYNSIIGKFGVGQQYEGWRYASLADISNLWVSAGANSDYFTGSSTQNNGVVATLEEHLLPLL